MNASSKPSGRLIKAPEHFLDPQGVQRHVIESRQGRRDFIRQAFAAAATTAAVPAAMAAANPVPAEGGDPNILNLDRKSTRLNSSHSQQSRMPSSA